MKGKEKKWGMGILTATLLCICSAACIAAENDTESGSSASQIYSVLDFGANGADTEDDSAAFVAALAVAATSEDPITVYVPAGTYYINKGLSIYSDTSLILDDEATIISTYLQGAMLIGRHVNEDGTICPGDQTCTHGGYSQIQNVTVSGGTWNRNDANGDGNNTIIVLRHGSNIVVENLVCKNATNHFINLSGVQNAVVDHVTCMDMATYTGDDPSFWGSNEVGDKTRYSGIEAIHLDYMTEEGEPEVYPYDSTPCSNVTVSNCVFSNVYAGVGTHHLAENLRATGITVKDCQFTNVLFHCVNVYDFDDVVVEGNTVGQAGVFVYSVGSTGGVSANTIDGTNLNALYFCDGSVFIASGNTITAAAEAGIRADGNCRLTVSSNNILNPGTHGISVSNQTTLTAADNTIEAPNGSGIYMGDLSSGTLTGNQISNTQTGINITAGCTDCSVAENIISTTVNSGISVGNQSAAIISLNTITDAGDAGISGLSGSELSVYDNQIINPSTHGISVSTQTALNAERNIINAPNGSGIYMGSSSSGTLTGNQITDVQTGINITVECIECVVENNTISTAVNNGIAVNNSSIVTASLNTITDTGKAGISVLGGSKLSVSDTEIVNPGVHGISVSDQSELIAMGNTIEAPSGSGIYLGNTSRGTLTDNQISNVQTGVTITAGCTDCTLSANRISTTVNNAIYVNGESSAVIDSNVISNAGTAGIRADSNCNLTVINNEIIRPQTHGVSVANCTQLTAAANMLSECGGSGFYINGSCSGTLSGNSIDTAVENAIYIYDNSTVVVENNELRGIGNVGIRANLNCDVTVNANQIVSAVSHGISVSGNSVLSADGNTISSPSGCGIYLLNGDGSTITGNEITQSGSAGIYVAYTNDCVIDKNKALDSASHAIIIIGNTTTPSTVSVTNNTAITVSGTSYDIRLSTYCLDCVVTDNIIGDRGVSVDPTSTCTLSNNDKAAEEEDPDAELAIIAQPEDVVVKSGESFVMNVTATGSNLSYQWYYKKADGTNFNPWKDKTRSTLSATTNETYEGMQVYCVITDGSGNTVTSEIAVIYFLPPIVITVQPQDVTIAAGEQLSFSVEATGEELTYQWYYKKTTGVVFSKWSGKTSASFTAGSNATYDGMQVYCEITDKDGNSVTSDTAVIYIQEPSGITITAQPQDITIAAGEQLSFSVEATGEGLTYQWYYKKTTGIVFSKWSGKTNASFTAGSNATYDGMQVYCEITDKDGNSVTSDTVVIYIQEPSGITITAQPQDITIAAGEQLSFSVEATGEGLTYQWYYKKTTGIVFSKWSGKTSASFTAGSNATYDGMQVYCEITDKDGNSVTSDTVVIYIQEPSGITIIAQPQDVTIAAGEQLSFSVEATGEELTYQWYYKKTTGVVFSKWSGKTSASFTAGSNATYDGMQVYCEITDKDGNSVTSDTVVIYIQEPSGITITTQPQDVTIVAGEQLSFSVEATGEELTYQWYYKKTTGVVFSKWSGKTSASFTAGSNATYDGMQVYCEITDKDGNSVTSDTAVIYIQEPSGITITAQPQDITIAAGEQLSFSVGATGEGLTYQWYYKKTTGVVFSKWSGKTNASFTAGSNATYDGMQVYCEIADKDGNSVTSDTVVIYIV